jgi:2-dehydro-3-deoxyphosphooctonate aldolase (KDO 8-P synthase)
MRIIMFELIAGPCVIEDKIIMEEIVVELIRVSIKHNVDLIFKSSFDKANRTSINSFRGPGLTEGMKILSDIKQKYNVSIVTDIHESFQADIVSHSVDVIQIPAYLARQTDLLLSAARTGKAINIKKSQFLAPWDMKNVIEKILSVNPSAKIYLTERGTFFGYNNLVVDMTSLIELRKLGHKVIFDATHSVQKPGGGGDKSGGNRDYAKHLALAAAAVGIDGLFIEVHPNPEYALSDGANTINLYDVDDLLTKLLYIHKLHGA